MGTHPIFESDFDCLTEMSHPCVNENEESLFLVKSRNLKFLFSKIRDVKTKQKEFSFYSMRIMKLIAEDAIALIGGNECEIETPCGTWSGIDIKEEEACAVSIIRAGDSMLEAVRSIVPGISVGKILIQRDEESREKNAKLFYKKLPKNIRGKKVILCDPMLATGCSAVMAMECLLECGVAEDDVIFANVVSCPEGISKLIKKFPKIKIVTGMIDEKLNENKYIVPGLGDYGDRFYGTC